ncbi:hypothetical protein BS78_08G157100 [Paspalum vaginatum]|nr:hypothetical protein BS78_08G157100 [Paspalum vaginatum]
MSMDPDSEVEHDFPPFLRQYKSGRVERYRPTDAVPAGTGVSSRDVVINTASGLWARLFLPATRHREAEAEQHKKQQRLAVVVYYHGGAFVRGSTAERATHLYLTRLAADAGVLVVSPEYRLAPEHPLPTAFEDSTDYLQVLQMYGVIYLFSANLILGLQKSCDKRRKSTQSTQELLYSGGSSVAVTPTQRTIQLAQVAVCRSLALQLSHEQEIVSLISS